MSASNRKNRSFRIENLEDRKMFAADLGGAAADLAVDPTQLPAQVADQTPVASSTTLGDFVCPSDNPIFGNDQGPAKEGVVTEEIQLFRQSVPSLDTEVVHGQCFCEPGLNASDDAQAKDGAFAQLPYNEQGDGFKAPSIDTDLASQTDLEDVAIVFQDAEATDYKPASSDAWVKPCPSHAIDAALDALLPFLEQDNLYKQFSSQHTGGGNISRPMPPGASYSISDTTSGEEGDDDNGLNFSEVKFEFVGETDLEQKGWNRPDPERWIWNETHLGVK